MTSTNSPRPCAPPAAPGACSPARRTSRCRTSASSFISAVPDVGWKKGGYLFIVPPRRRRCAQGQLRNPARSMACSVELLDRRRIAGALSVACIPPISPPARTRSTTAGAIRTACCNGLRRQARSLGVEYLRDKVVGFEHNNACVRKAHLASGAVLAADCLRERRRRLVEGSVRDDRHAAADRAAAPLRALFRDAEPRSSRCPT